MVQGARRPTTDDVNAKPPRAVSTGRVPQQRERKASATRAPQPERGRRTTGAQAQHAKRRRINPADDVDAQVPRPVHPVSPDQPAPVGRRGSNRTLSTDEYAERRRIDRQERSIAMSQAESASTERSATNRLVSTLTPSSAKPLSAGDGTFLGTLGSPRALCVMFFSAAVMETWMEIKHGNIPPRPARYVGIGLVYGILAGISHFWPPVAGILGLGLTFALAAKIGAQNPGTAGTPTPLGGGARTGGAGSASPGGGVVAV